MISEIKHPLKKVNYTSETIPHNRYFTFIDDSQELMDVLNTIGFLNRWKKDITAALVEIIDGDYGQIYLSESSNYYSVYATFRPLPYYLTPKLEENYDNLPAYWKVESYE